MIGYLPSPYKGEILYSILARCSKHMGIFLKYEFLTKFFDTGILSTNVEFIGNIEHFTKKVVHFSEHYTPDFFINNHTTLPFYIPFGHSNKKRQSNGELDVPLKEHLYFCTSCLKEQFEKHGEGYWNRLFQIPGVLVCSQHSEILNRTAVNIVRQLLKRFELPDFSLEDESETFINKDTIKDLAKITDNINYFLCNIIEVVGHKNLYLKYLEYIKSIGIAIPMSRMNQKFLMILRQENRHRFFYRAYAWWP